MYLISHLPLLLSTEATESKNAVFFSSPEKKIRKVLSLTDKFHQKISFQEAYYGKLKIIHQT
jgi:hypothetical protein